MTYRRLFGAALSLLALGACNGTGIGADSQNVIDQNGADDAPAEQLLIVSRQDFRECTFPMCGGVFVKAIDAEQTICADGTRADDCYVAAIDFEALGLEAELADELGAQASSGHVVMLGSIALSDGAFPAMHTLAVSKALVGQAQSDAGGAFYRGR
jgi:hypothetical protein